MLCRNAVLRCGLLAVLLTLTIAFPLKAALAQTVGEWYSVGSATNVYSLAVDSANPDVICAATDNDVYKSPDGGANWNTIGFDSMPAPTVALVPGTQTIFVGAINSFYRSDDGSETWPIVWEFSSGVRSVAVDPGSSNIVYVATLDGAYKSTDGGAYFDQMTIATVSGGQEFQSIGIDPSNSQVLYLGSGNADKAIYKSIDGGSNWSLVAFTSAAILSIQVDPTNSQVIYAAGTNSANGGGILYKSANGGSSWSSKISVSFAVYSVMLDPANAQTVYIGTDFGVYRSPNGGDSWNTFSTGLGNFPVRSLAPGSSGTQTIYAGTWGGGVWRVDQLDCIAPEAAFTWSTPVYIWQPINFTDTSTGTFDTWTWDFGDDVSSTEQNPVHLYSNTGDFEVCLTVSGTCGTSTICDSVTVGVECTPETPPPSAIFTPSATQAYVGDTISFTNESPGMIDSFTWDFADGTGSAQVHPTHSYSEAGTYNVCLTVVGPCGSDTGCVEITILPVCTAPTAAFTPDSTTAVVGETIAFTDQSTGTVDSWLWNFGDGSTSTFQNPTHTYAAAGTYNVCLTISSSCGTDSVCSSISVSPRLNLTCSPNSTSIRRGGRLNYTVTAANLGDTSVTFEYWTKVIMPNGQPYPSSGALYGPVTVTLTPFQSRTVTLSQTVPTSAPAGSYTYRCYVGTYPDLIEDECQFPIRVTLW